MDNEKEARIKIFDRLETDINDLIVKFERELLDGTCVTNISINRPFIDIESIDINTVHITDDNDEWRIKELKRLLNKI